MAVYNTSLTRDVVKEYGMSRELGQVYFAHDNKNRFMIQDPGGGGEYSENTANLIDREIRKIIDEQYEKALEILRTNRNITDQAAEKLLENEIIEGEEIKALSDAVSQITVAREDVNTSDSRQVLAA